MQGIQLRRAILEAVQRHQDAGHPAPIRQDELARHLGVPEERMEAHFIFLERSQYVQFLHMPGPDGERMRFVTITDQGRDYLADASNFARPESKAGPFKVVDKSDDGPLRSDIPALRDFVERTEWVLDEEKPPILAKLDELQGALEGDFDPAKVSELKLHFERHRWLAPHVQAVIKKAYGF